MSRTWLLASTGGFALLLMCAAFFMLQTILRQQRMAVRVQMSRGHAPPPAKTREELIKGAWSRVLGALGQLMLRTGLLSARTRADLELTLMSAGLRGANGLEIFIGGKIGLVVGLPLIAVAVTSKFALPTILMIALPAVAAVAGLLLPDMVVRYRRNHYIQRVERGLPDALDLLVICSQAGLGLGASIVQVSEEMQHGNVDIGLEFAITANELQLMADNRQALLNLGSRTGVSGLVRLGTTLIQSLQYGTPLTESMRILSAEIRQDTLTRFEARAARLGVLLTLPMIIFILPCVFLVVGGPAAIQVMGVGG